MTCCSLIYQFNFPTLLILTDQPDIVCSLFPDNGRAWVGTLAVFAMVKMDTDFWCTVMLFLISKLNLFQSVFIFYSQVLCYYVKFWFGYRFLKNILHHDLITMSGDAVKQLLL